MKKLEIVIEKPRYSIEEVAGLQAQKASQEQQLEEKRKQLLVNPYAEIIGSLDKGIEELQARLDKSRSELNENEVKIPYYEFLAVAFGKDIKAYIINQLIESINAQLHYWMGILYQNCISLEFDRDLKVTMRNHCSRKSMVYGQASGGEKKRIDLAVLLSFRNVMKLSSGRDPSIMFLDEVMDGIDLYGADKVYDALVELAKTQRVFVITHNPILLEMLSAHDELRVRTQNGQMAIVN